MRILLLPVGLLVAGCEERSCAFDDVVPEYIGGAELEDCGDLPIQPLGAPPDRAPWSAAHDCVVAANAAQRPFVVRFATQGIEGYLQRAYVGDRRDEAWVLSHFVRGFSSDASQRPTRRYECAALDDDGDCARLPYDLCLSCAGMELMDPCASE